MAYTKKVMISTIALQAFLLAGHMVASFPVSEPQPIEARDATSLTQLWGTQGNNYSTVYLHGLLGWGENRPLLGFMSYFGGATHNILEILRSEFSYTIVAPNMGALSSCWERACEAYAQLTGTVTEYGYARSAHFKHNHTGNDYSNLEMLPGFRHALENNLPFKMNLVGHSQGGPTARLLTHLLTYGSQDEMDACAAMNKPCSPLFWTNKTQTYVNGVFTISGVHQGSVVVDFLQASGGLITFIKGMVSALVGLNNVNNIDLFDLQLGHWGLEQKSNEPFLAYLDRIFESDWFFSQSNSLFDLGVASLESPLLSFVKNSPTTTYFSIAGLTTTDFLGVSLADISTNLFMVPFANIVGTYSNSSLPALQRYTQKEWRENDGVVMLASSRSPASGFVPFMIEMQSKNIASAAPKTAPSQGTYNYVGTWDVTDHLAEVGLMDLVPGLRDNVYVNIMKVLSSLSP